jgi:NAD kinase
MMRPSIALVTTATRLQGLLARWGTKGAARFRINQAVQHAAVQSPAVQSAQSSHFQQKTQQQATSSQADVEFHQYEQEDAQYQSTLETLRREIDLGFPVTIVERKYLPNFDFRNVVVIVVLGHDGLVANTAKYAGELPIIGVNPDKARNDGILVPFAVSQVRRTLKRTLDQTANSREVTLAQANMNDGQTLLAFNDFFIGRKTHVSARYTLHYQGDSEPQSSSGVIVATGAGSTGWLSSVFNMTRSVSEWTGGQAGAAKKLRWEDRELAWVVREPFVSKHSQANLVAGTLDAGDELVMESLMPESGVVFSDGVEQDFLEFNSGSTVRIQTAPHRARLVVPE